MTTNSKVALLAALAAVGISAGCGKIQKSQLVGTWETTQPMSPSVLSRLVGQLPENVEAGGNFKIRLQLFDDGRFSQFGTMSIGGFRRQNPAVAVIMPRFEIRFETYGRWRITTLDELRLTIETNRAVPVSESAKEFYKRNPAAKTAAENERGTIGGRVTSLSANEFTLHTEGDELIYRRVDE